MRRMTWLGLVAWAVIGCIMAGAQAPPSTSSSTFRSRADLVLVPVIVHDKQGKHVPGLSAEDFRLEDNGARQKIASVEEVEAETSVPAPPPELKADIVRGVAFTNQLAAPNRPKQLIIFAIDLINAPFADTHGGRQAMLAFVSSHMRPNVTMGLVAMEPGRARLLHAFTTSPSILSGALQKVTAQATPPPALVPQTELQTEQQS